MEVNDKYPLITVIMPCYNAEHYIQYALRSILDQSYSNLDILCIDDGSTDSTLRILEGFSQSDKRIRVVSNTENIKLIKTLNKGIKMAKGEYIARMDADDISHPNRIKSLFEFLIKHDLDLVSCNVDFIDATGVRLRDNYLKCTSQKELELSSYLFTPIAHAAMIVKKDVIDRFLYNNEGHALHVEDYELWTRMIRNRVAMGNLDKILYSVRLNEQSVSSNYEQIQRKHFVQCAQIHQNYLLGYKPETPNVQIAVNRIEKLDMRGIKNGFNLINEIMVTYDAKTNKPLAPVIINQHKLDILIQIIKSKKIKPVLWALTKVLFLILRNINNSNFRKYMVYKSKR